jgi:hypothetical protein
LSTRPRPRRDLPLDLLGRQAGCLGDDADLHVGDVRVGLDGGVQIGEHAIGGDRRGGGERHQAAIDDEGDE